MGMGEEHEESGGMMTIFCPFQLVYDCPTTNQQPRRKSVPFPCLETLDDGSSTVCAGLNTSTTIIEAQQYQLLRTLYLVGIPRSRSVSQARDPGERQQYSVQGYCLNVLVLGTVYRTLQPPLDCLFLCTISWRIYHTLSSMPMLF